MTKPLLRILRVFGYYAFFTTIMVLVFTYITAQAFSGIQFEGIDSLVLFGFGFALCFPCITLLDALIATIYYRFGTERTKWFFLLPLKVAEATIMVFVSVGVDWLIDGVSFHNTYHILLGFSTFLSVEMITGIAKRKEETNIEKETP